MNLIFTLLSTLFLGVLTTPIPQSSGDFVCSARATVADIGLPLTSMSSNATVLVCIYETIGGGSLECDYMEANGGLVEFKRGCPLRAVSA